MTVQTTELWVIYVPTIFNDGRPIKTRYHRVWDTKVCAIAGGMTVLQPIFGKWIHKGTSYQERNIPVTVACSRDHLFQILKMTKEYYQQEAIMAYKISDEAIIYDL